MIFSLLLLIIHEKCPLSFKEYAVSLLFVSVSEGAVAMHLAMLPLTRVHATIRPLEHAVAMSLVIHVVAFVDATIWPRVLTPTMHVTRVPLTDKLAPIKPFISPMSLHLVIDPVTGVERAIWPEVCAKSILLTLLEMPVKA